MGGESRNRASSESPGEAGIDLPGVPNIYYDRQFNTQAAKILPGEYYVTKRDMMIVTVLGSCVSACIRDRETGVGGMNHFMLPHSDADPNNPLSTSTRYGTYAMEMLINHLLKLGARRQCLEAKLFGGGNVMQGFTVNKVGTRNAEFALSYLETEQISVVSKDLLDIHPRKVYYFPQTGRVLVKKLRNLHNETISQREQQYQQRIVVEKVSGDVELFT
ncbi:MAG: chemoreceptor glutamine deamidase CheD [Hydrogenophilales bacterium]|nr:chemoreceptor glutamine deamidase CheD [Hydrogenophilales bacterium]